MPHQLIKVTAFYRLDNSATRRLNALRKRIDVHSAEAAEADALFIYRGWCVPDDDGDPDPMASDFGQIRYWLAQEFSKRYPQHGGMFEFSNFNRISLTRGWPSFERLPDIPHLPRPPEESKA